LSPVKGSARRASIISSSDWSGAFIGIGTLTRKNGY